MSGDIALAQEYKRRVENAFGERIAKIVLFGSRARGDSRPDSDWDIAIFLADEPSSDDLNRLADLGTDLLYETGQFIQPLPLAGRRQQEDSYLMRAIRSEGVAL